ncbi:MAG TPA: hypothetical protein VGQ57_15060 [Polyangiaceae bacterium]|jgi:hypothetical protein|nr:hypothetical protein [Polyangiaceae bacterium]
MATEETVSTIAKALGESDEVPMGQISGVVRVLGEEQSLKLLDETKSIETKGGMMLPDNSRKRSIGGVFFFLARQKLSQEDKLAIFRSPRPVKPASASSEESTRFPRRRVIEVTPARPAPARGSRPGFLPPELPVAVRRVKVREAVQTAVSALPAEDQYGVLLDIIAELHERLGYRVPESQRGPLAFDPPTRPGAPLGGPPSSQRPIPIPIPESARAPESARQPTGAPPPAEATVEKPKRTAARAKRSS